MARAVAILIALSAGALLVACGTDASKSATTTTEQLTTTSATTTTQDTTPDPTPTTSTFPPGSTEAQVATAFVEAFDSYFLASTTPADPTDLSAYFDSPALEVAESNLRTLVNEGRISIYPDGLPAIDVETVTLVGPTDAEVIACLVDTGFNAEPGAEHPAPGSAISRQAKAIVTLTDTWRVRASETVQVWENDLGCDQ